MRDSGHSSAAHDAAILLIDGECVLCNRFARFLIRRDPAERLRFAALQSPVASAMLRERGLSAPPPGTVVLVRGNAVFIRSEATLRTLGLLPVPWRWLWALRVVPRPMRDLGYDLVARVRLRFLGRTPLCAVLDAAERARFLPGGDSAEENPAT